MIGKGDFYWSGMGLPKTRAPSLILVALAILLGALFHNKPARAANVCPAPSFAGPSTYDAGWKPISLAVDDFNGDGKPDLAVANWGAGRVSVLLGKGNGAFQSPVTSEAGSLPTSIVAGDFNGDAKRDLVVVNPGTPWNDYTNSSISVFLGKGDGTFQAASNTGAGLIPVSAAVGDFDGDGKADLAVANSGSNNVSVLLGQGEGIFHTATTYAAGASPRAVAVGDFNADGKPDLAVANFANPYPTPTSTVTTGTVSVLLGRGDGTFQDGVNYRAGLGARSVAVGDFNGDGKLDLALANNGSHPILDSIWNNGNVSVLLGNSDGTFQGAVNYDAGWGPASLAVADLNGDGKPDLVINNLGYVGLGLAAGPVSVLLNGCSRAGARLDVTRSDANLTLSWPLSSTGFVLESTTSLGSRNWRPATEEKTTNNGHFAVSVPLDHGQRYFRLRKR